MIKINYQNLQIKLSPEKYQTQLDKIKKSPAPSFESNKTDINYIINQSKKYKKYKNVILIANGGSRTSAYAFYQSLANFRNKVNFEFVTSSEPDIINRIKKQYSPKNTLILIISKSGSNINSIEPLLVLINYTVLAITGEKENTLSEIAKKMKWETIVHPEVEGRYSGMTSCGLVPAYLMGLDIKKIYKGATEGYEKFSAKNGLERNSALKLAAYFLELEKQDYTEIFSPIYSFPLFGFLPLVIQLIHEGTGKDGKGQTIFGDLAPESQHHTNQRFLGGRKNVIGMFVGEEKTFKDYKINIFKSIGSVLFREYPLKKLNGLSASDVLKYDRQGVCEHTKSKKIPVTEIIIEKINEEAIGEFMVFWHYFAMYSAILRNQNPFNQPEVEYSKKISLELRMNRK